MSDRTYKAIGKRASEGVYEVTGLLLAGLKIEGLKND